MTTEDQTRYLLSILPDAKRITSNCETNLSEFLSVAAVLSNWGKAPFDIESINGAEIHTMNRFLQMAVRQVEKSSAVTRICSAVDCAQET